MAAKLSKKLEIAAGLVAEDGLTDTQIADKCGISQRTLERWKKQPHFRTRVQQISDAYATRVLAAGIARKERRIAALNDLHNKLQQVIAERAADPGVAQVAGGTTGLVVKTVRGLGKVEVFEVDTGLIRELRAVQQQAAEELGQFAQKLDLTAKVRAEFSTYNMADLSEDELNELYRLVSKVSAQKGD